MDKSQSIHEENRSKKVSGQQNFFAVEGRTHMTEQELISGIRDKIQELLRK